MATMAAAARVRAPLLRLPTAAPIPTTTARYTSVANAPSTPMTTVFLTTTSRSYSRYFRTATPEARGIPSARTEMIPYQKRSPRMVLLFSATPSGSTGINSTAAAPV